jgi:hypothetical protein
MGIELFEHQVNFDKELIQRKKANTKSVIIWHCHLVGLSMSMEFEDYWYCLMSTTDQAAATCVAVGAAISTTAATMAALAN